jgi:hypothetical protein
MNRRDFVVGGACVLVPVRSATPKYYSSNLEEMDWREFNKLLDECFRVTRNKNDKCIQGVC